MPSSDAHGPLDNARATSQRGGVYKGHGDALDLVVVPLSLLTRSWRHGEGQSTPDVMAVSVGVGEARCSVASYLTFTGPGVVVVTRPRRRYHTRRRRRLLAPNVIAASSSTNFGGVETQHPQLSPNLAVGRNGRRNSGAVVGKFRRTRRAGSHHPAASVVAGFGGGSSPTSGGTSSPN